MKIRVLFFAKSRELAGQQQREFNDVPAKITGAELLSVICDQVPGLSKLRDSLVLAVNQEYVDKDTQLHLTETSEIAVIPPISGG
eukprot:m.115487 g.115487  ORF g.115487 m.115487 type:complete len:85 (-) comp22987_c0_seq2:884-1138(-)